LKLNISENDNAMELALAQSVAPYFRVTAKEANEVIERSQAVVTQWRKIADQLGISAREQDRMTPAFRLAE
jgi:serine/threonine-protein kinase HipA